jgi:large subunit ribosomal protein L9
VKCTIAAKVSDASNLYGSVTVRDVMDALAAQGVVVEKRMVLMSEPIKALGSYPVAIRVYKDVEPQVTVEVVSE